MVGMKMGCTLLCVIWGVAMSLPALLWPIGSLLGMGTWHRMPPQGKKSGGWQFQFSAEYGVPELVYLAAVFGLVFYAIWWVTSSTRQGLSLFSHLPRPLRTASGLSEALAARPEQLLVEVDSDRESLLNRRKRWVFWGPLLMVFGIRLIDGFVGSRYWLGMPLSPTRWACVALGMAPGLSLLYRGLGAWRARALMEDRLLIRFSERNLGWVDLGDTRARFPEPLARFEETGVVLCKVKHSQLKTVLRLRLPAGKPLDLLKSYDKDEFPLIETVGQELAERMGLELEYVEEEELADGQVQ